jgi:hypothetical protein
MFKVQFVVFLGRGSSNQITLEKLHSGWKVVGIKRSATYCVHSWMAGKLSQEILKILVFMIILFSRTMLEHLTD